ncbi:MAG: phosphate/phosphite/phosphonate ABC transporter substrate-binding protein [Magnetococcales bacterium]|nr:phosphate/phosphite/phosphonate ABC transporter substrate-binding protein [Magnetococcales bacterium]
MTHWQGMAGSGRVFFATGLAWLLLMAVGPALAEEIRGEAPGLKQGEKRAETLVIGRVTNRPKKHIEGLRGMVNYVVPHLARAGIRQGRVVFARDNAQMQRYLAEGRVDWVSESAFSALEFRERSGAQLLLRRWKGGVAEYHTVFITRIDSPIQSLADLKGRRIAFEDAGSTSAFQVPAATLLEENLELVELNTPRESPAAHQVGYAFAGGEINVVTWVSRGLADAGAVSNLDWHDSERVPEGIKKQLRIFHRTDSFPRGVELVRGGLDPAVKAGLKELLLQAHLDPEGVKALKGYNKTSRFDDFSGGVEALMAPAYRLWPLLNKATDQ